MDVFVNMSQCDKSNKEGHDTLKDEQQGCEHCRIMEKKYLKSEAKYLKAVDRLQKIQTDLELT